MQLRVADYEARICIFQLISIKLLHVDYTGIIVLILPTESRQVLCYVNCTVQQ